MTFIDEFKHFEARLNELLQSSDIDDLKRREFIGEMYSWSNTVYRITTHMIVVLSNENIIANLDREH